MASRTNVRRSWVLASYHSPHSLTWRWADAADREVKH